LRGRIGYVFQGAALLGSLSVEENIALPLVERRLVPRGEIAARVAEVLRLVHLSGAERKRPDELSGGMRKRVGLARALVTRPKIILYDEPTTGLDPVITQTIDELIVELREQLGVTSLVIRHDVAGARFVSDRMALLHQGRIVAEGTPDEMAANPDPVVRQFLRGETHGPLTERLEA
jgi:phospholipid/cholesterol/gamma-HCH transport system ATP-binding protein